MSALKWNRTMDQYYEAGVDRGVLYPEGADPVVWNGLISVEDAGESTTKDLYLDGIKFLTLVSARDWKGNIEALTFPDEFTDLIGIAEMGDGLYVDSQVPGRFGLSYRTMISNADDKVQHYKIHLIYAATASLGAFTHETLGDSTNPTPFQFEINAIPQEIPGFRPSAHIIIDTRKIDEITRGTIEGMLYGNGFRDPSLPTVTQLVDLLNFSGPVVVTDNGDGTWTAVGSNDNIKMLDRDYFRITNVAAEPIDEDTYRFLGTDGIVTTGVLIADVDGVPYFSEDMGLSNVGIDDDGVPYFDEGASGAVIREDTDGRPYFDLV